MIKPGTSNAIITAVVFAVFGLLWIFFTDDLFYQIAGKNIDVYREFQNWKGAIFVLLSSLLVFFVSRKLNRSLDASHRELQESNLQLRKLNHEKIAQEIQLKKTRERLDLISKATGDAIWEYDFESGSSHANDMVYEIFEIQKNDGLMNMGRWTRNIHPDDRLRIASRLEKSLHGDLNSWFDEYRYLTQQAGYKWIIDHGFVMKDENNKPIRMVGAMKDVTKQRKLEQDLTTQKILRNTEIAQATLKAQELERKQLGLELHDNINQLLATTKLYLDHAIHHPQINRELILKAIEYILKIISEVRSLSHSLSPPSLGDIGLQEALQELFNQQNKASTTVWDFQVLNTVPPEISREIQINLYRICQELINNTIKHAKASRVEAVLEVNDQLLQLRFFDNGIGFNTQIPSAGMGLNSLRNRTELYGGTLSIQSQPGKGTTICLSMQLEKQIIHQS